MLLSDFDFYLPDELIAQVPCEQRSQSRLMTVQGQNISHQQFSEIVDKVEEHDLLVVNNARVMNARLRGVKASGGQLELLVERVIDHQTFLAQIKASRALKADSTIYIQRQGFPDVALRVGERQDRFYFLSLKGDESAKGEKKPINLDELMDVYGEIPLPPYIKREAADTMSDLDRERYQTVYAKHLGAVAAPTAGLHFDNELLNKIKTKGAQIGEVTLFVGSGTFQPVQVENVNDHKMHEESFVINEELVNQVKQAKKQGGRIIAIGTTSLRALESASNSDGELMPFSGETDIFIYPGYQFKCVDILLTNFHLPKSSLMMLVSAFAGFDNIKNAYQEAIRQKYRFFSYGDAMFLHKSSDAKSI